MKRGKGRPPAGGMSLRRAVEIIVTQPRQRNKNTLAALERLKRFLEKGS